MELVSWCMVGKTQLASEHHEANGVNGHEEASGVHVS